MASDVFGGAAPVQASVWDLQARAPQPQVLVKQAVNGVSAAWPVVFTVSQGNFVQLQEVLLYNGDAASRSFALAFLDEDDAIPSGSSINQDNIFINEVIGSGMYVRLDLSTALQQGWRICAYSSAAAGVKTNFLITGLVVTYLA